MGTDYDVIVVGARCAGSPTAMLLARQGHRVLLVDRATFPSDTVSTHVVHAPGVAALARWGLLEAVTASGCPPVEEYAFDFGPITISGPSRAVEGISRAYAPRRTVLDTVLVEGAAAAGVEVRQDFTVEEVLVDDGAVTGIRGHGEGGASVTERASVVVGADGRSSRVARVVDPEEYHVKPPLQWSYYTYWSGLPVDGMEIVIRPDRGFAAVPTNDGLTLVVVGWPVAEQAAYKADAEANYLATLELAPALADRVRQATREDRFHGASVPNFFRRPFGPGWALVGDAGYTKDPITAQGICDAFRDAELCSTAIHAALEGTSTFEAAMGDYQRRRDEQVLPVYEFTTQLATLSAPPPEMQQLLGAVHGDPELMSDFVSVTTGVVSPAAFFDPANVGRMFAAAGVPVVG